MHDPVNRPSHYTNGDVECIEAIESSMSPEAFRGFLKANCIKYLWRYENKNGLEDLKKCKWYLDTLIADVQLEIIKKKMDEKESLEMLGVVNHDPDDYMISGCPDGFCPLPNVRTGPSESMFQPIN